MERPQHRQTYTSPTDPAQAIDEPIRGLLAAQPFAVLCTQSDGQPYGTVVAYAYTADLKRLVFATPADSRKYRQLCACDRVALVVDSKPALADQIMQGEALTATGQAVELAPGAEHQELAALLAARHPHIASFFTDPSSALFGVHVDQYVHVSRFQKVQSWIPGTGQPEA